MTAIRTPDPGKAMLQIAALEELLHRGIDGRTPKTIPLSLRAPSTYTLKAVLQPLPNDTQPLPSVPQPSKQASLPTSEEIQKNLFEERKKKVGAKESRPASRLSDLEWLGSLKADQAYVGIDVEREHAKMVRWCQASSKHPTRRRFINWLNRCDRPIAPNNSTRPDHAKGF